EAFAAVESALQPSPAGSGSALNLFQHGKQREPEQGADTSVGGQRRVPVNAPARSVREREPVLDVELDRPAEDPGIGAFPVAEAVAVAFRLGEGVKHKRGSSEWLVAWMDRASW